MLTDEHCLSVWLHGRHNEQLLNTIRNKVVDLYKLLVIALGGVWGISLYCMNNDIHAGIMFCVWGVSMLWFLGAVSRLNEIDEGLSISYGLFMHYLAKNEEKLVEYQRWKVDYVRMKSEWPNPYERR